MSLPIIDGFDNRSNNPLDYNYIVADVAALSVLQFRYKGMMRWVESEQNVYILQNDYNTWKPIAAGKAISRWVAGSYAQYDLVISADGLFESQKNNNSSVPGVNGDWTKILGQKGDKGDTGLTGKSAYQVWLDNGNTGSVTVFLNNLKGATGSIGADGIPGAPGVGLDIWNPALAAAEGYLIDDLVRYDGQFWECTVDNNHSEPGTDDSWLLFSDGRSAYQVAFANGFEGTEGEWLDSLTGPAGTPGADGVPGAAGADGTNGTDGVGVGVASGGTSGQVLAKIDATDYNTVWVDQTGGGGSPQVELFPHTIDTGDGTELSPYENADDTAGIQTQIDILAAGRGGAVKLAASRFDISAQILITSSGIKIAGVVAGYNIDPNAIYEGISATVLIVTGSGISIAGAGYPGRTGAVILESLYLFGITTRQAIGSTTGTIGVELKSYIDQPTLKNINIGGFDYGIKANNTSGGGFIDFSYFHQTNIQGTRIGVFYDSVGSNSGQHYTLCCISEQDEHCVYVTLASTNTNFVFTSVAFYRGSSASGVTNPANVYFGGSNSRFIGCEFCQAGDNLVGGFFHAADGLILAGNYNSVSGCEFVVNGHGYGLNISGHDNAVTGCVFVGNYSDVLVSGNNNSITGCSLNHVDISGDKNTLSGCVFDYNVNSINITGNNNTLYIPDWVLVTDTGLNNTIIGGVSILKPGGLPLAPIRKGMQLLPTLTTGGSATLAALEVVSLILDGLGTVFVVNGGGAYTNGTYPNVPLTAALGNGALGTVVISGNAIASVTRTTPGLGYALGKPILISPADVGGTGSGYSGLMMTGNTTNATYSGLIIDGIPYGSGGGVGALVNNIAIGPGALQNNTIGGSGSPIAAVGYMALNANKTGLRLTAFGTNVFPLAENANDNVGFGTNVGGSIIDGSRNSLFGNNAGNKLVSRNDCAAYGYNAIKKTESDYVSGFGSNCGQDNVSGEGNYFGGAFSGQEVNSPYNTIAGFNGSGGTGATGRNTLYGAKMYFNGAAFHNHVMLSEGDGNIRLLVDDAGRVMFLASANQGTLQVAPVTSTFTVPQVTDKGSLPWPKMTTSQRTAISSPLEGISVYDTDLHKLFVYDGTAWQGAW